MNNKIKKAIEELEKGIEIAFKRITKLTKQIETGIIISVGTNEGYKINLNNIEYDNILSINGVTLNENDTAIVVMPNGQINNMFILGKLG